MELSNEFRVPVPVDAAWDVLTDVEGIAPCMPGAQLQEIEGDEFRGIVKVKVGPITAQYKGTASWQEQDRPNNKLVLKASGRDTRGQGNASAIVTCQLTPDGDGTKVVVDTDLTISGKVAQFGRGVLADVSSKLIDQFVECLSDKIESGDLGSSTESKGDESTIGATAAATGAAAAGSAGSATTSAGAAGTATTTDAPTSTGGGTSSNGATTEAPKVRKIHAPEAEPVDLMGTAGAPVAKRAIPVVIVLLLLLLLGRRRRRRS